MAKTLDDVLSDLHEVADTDFSAIAHALSQRPDSTTDHMCVQLLQLKYMHAMIAGIDYVRHEMEASGNEKLSGWIAWLQETAAKIAEVRPGSYGRIL